MRGGKNAKIPVPLGERVTFILIGAVIGLVVGVWAGTVSALILGRAMGNSLGNSITVAIMLLFSNGYPRASRGHAAALFAGMMAVGLLLGWLRG